ncbi:hypothetical protein ABK040_009752 [Willaertia magna]
MIEEDELDEDNEINNNNNNNTSQSFPICETVSECIPCEDQDKSNPNNYCEQTGYYHLIECHTKENPKDKKRYKESCRPDIIYTPYSVINLLIFEGVLFIIILVAGYMFYNRTKYLSELQRQRYQRLVQN